MNWWIGWVSGAVLCMGAVTEGKVTPADFSQRAEIVLESGDGSVPARVYLSGGIVREAQSDSRDLRVFDDRQHEVPYVIYRHGAAIMGREYYGLKVLAYRDLPRGCELVLERPEKREAMDGIAIQTGNRDFQKFVTIESSANRSQWKEVARDTLFDFSSRVDLRKAEVRFPSVTDRYLRVTLLDEAKISSAETDSGDLHVRYQGMDLSFKTGGKSTVPFRINGVNAWAGENERQEPVMDSSVIDMPRNEVDKDGNTLVMMDVGNVPVRALTLTTSGSPYYYRRVEIWSWNDEKKQADRWIGSGWIYRLPGMRTAETQITVNESGSPRFQIKVINGDNPPLSVERVSWDWLRYDLYFFAEPGRSYRLYFGAEKINPPNYETARLIPNPYASRDGSYTAATFQSGKLAAIEKNPQFQPPAAPADPRIQRYALIAGVILLGSALGYWAYSLMKQTAPPRT